MKINTIVLGPVAFLLGVVSITMLALIAVQPGAVVYSQSEPEATAEVESTNDQPENANNTDNDAEASETEESTTADEAMEQAEENTNAPAAFDFVAKECDALTYFVRKSLTLFDTANDDLSLSNEAIVYAETNIVQDIGPRLLAIDEAVSVDSSLVEKYARSSQELTPAQITAWAAYTNNVNFDLPNVSPVNDTRIAVTPEAIRVENQAAQEAEEQAAADAQAADAEAAEAAANDDDSASALWWVVGGGALAGLWYLLYRRNDDA